MPERRGTYTTHVRTLPDRFPSVESAIRWTSLFVYLGKHQGKDGTAADCIQVNHVLEKSGFSARMMVGLEPQVYKRDPDVFGKWVIGQIMDDLQLGQLPPVNCVVRFSEEYLAMIGGKP